MQAYDSVCLAASSPARSMLKLMRRRYQAGSIKDDGDRWVIRWREDVLENGALKRKQRWDVMSKREFPTKRLAHRELAHRLEEVNHEDYKPMPLESFQGFAERWKTSVMVQHKPSTQRSEKSVIDVHLVSAFGNFSLRDITAELLQTWVSGHKSSPKTVRNLVMTLRAMWSTAKAWGYVRHDPFEGLKLPTVQEGNAHHFTVEQTLAIINEAKGWKKAFFRILAETGMRPGELAGLRTQDIDGRRLSIRQSVWQRQVQTPKTPGSVRTFAISSGLAEEIRRHIVTTPANKHCLVFASETGRPLSMDNFRHRTLDPILRKLGVETDKRCGLYALRHMNLTLMDHLSIPLKTRQKRAGHADAATTLTHYTHAIDADDFAAAEQIGALLRPRSEDEAVQ